MWRNTCWSVCSCLNRNNRHQGTRSGRRTKSRQSCPCRPHPVRARYVGRRARDVRALSKDSGESHQAVELASGQRQRGASADIDIAPIERAPDDGHQCKLVVDDGLKDLATASPTNGIFVPSVSRRQNSQIPEKITYEHSRIRFSTAISFTLSRFPMAMSK
jgi:hypothetical protein